MKTHMHRFRKTVSAVIAMTVCSLFIAISCQKQELNLTPEELDTIKAHSIDYALQVIPDIHEVIPLDLIEAMNAIHDTTKNGRDTIICALHFGDNPPRELYRINSDNDTLGFVKDSIVVKTYIPSDTLCEFAILGSSNPGKVKIYPFCFRFHDQHRGVAKFDFKNNYRDNGPDDYAYEIAHVESAFIMGEGNLFTAYYFQNRVRQVCPIYPKDDYGPHEAVILSGRISEFGIHDLYYGFKILSYADPDPNVVGVSNYNIDDIAIYYKAFLPWAYWNPDQSYN